MSTTETYILDLIEQAGGTKAGPVRLAQVVSMAVRIDWALLRHARLHLLPDLGPSAEADLWAGPLVRSRGPDGFVLRADVAAWLQRRLANEDAAQKRLKAVGTMMLQQHKHLPPALRLEEELTYWGLLSKKDISDEDLERHLGQVVQALRDPERRSLTVWAERALERLPDRVQQLESAQVLRQSVRTWSDTGGRMVSDISDDADHDLWAMLVQSKSNERLSFLLRLAGGVLEIAPLTTDTASTPDDHSSVKIQVPDTDPLYLEVQWKESDEQRVARVFPRADEAVRLRVGTDLQLRFADGTGFAVFPSDATGVRQVYEAVAVLLKALPKADVLHAARQLGVEPASATSPGLLLAGLLVQRIATAGLTVLHTALKALIADIEPEAVAQLIDQLVPLWVNPVAARQLLEVTQRPPGRRVVFLNSEQAFTVELYVRRARLGMAPADVLQIDLPEGVFSSKVVLSEVEQALYDHFSVPPSALSKVLSNAEVPIVLLLNGVGLLDDTLEALTRQFPEVTLLLYGASESRTFPPDLVTNLEPALAPQAEAVFLREYEALSRWTAEAEERQRQRERWPRSFQNDLFISYAHIDNQPLSSKQGWITGFHRDLEAMLSRHLGRRVRIWRDEKLQGNDIFDEDVVAQFSETALFISVLTPRYVKSEWCLREVQTFCDVARRTGELVVDDKSRVFKVIRTPVESQDALPPEVSETLGYEFYDLNERGNPLELDPAFGEEVKQQYLRVLNGLSWDLAALLKQLTGDLRDEEPPLPDPDAFVLPPQKGGIKRFENHLFISYASLDNEPLTSEEQSWVTQFHRSLEAYLSMNLGEKARIWREEKLRGNNVFDEEVVRQFSETALCLAVITPAYLNSAWCLRELQEFIRVARETGGLIVDNKTRLFKVIKTPVERQDALPPEVSETMGYQFYTADEHEHPIELDPAFGKDSREGYLRRISILASDIAGLFRQLEKGIRVEEPPVEEQALPGRILLDAGADLGSVFISYAQPKSSEQGGWTIWFSEELRSWLSARLESPVEIRREDELQVDPYFKEDHIGATVEPTVLLVVLTPRYLESERCLEEVRTYYDTVRKRFGLVVNNKARIVKVISEPVETLEALPREVRQQTPNYTFYIKDEEQGTVTVDPTVREEFEEPFLQKINEVGWDLTDVLLGLEERGRMRSAPGGSNRRMIYLICAEQDRAAIRPLRPFMRAQGFDVNLPLFHDDPKEAQRYHEASLQWCDAVLIYYGEADQAWVDDTIADVRNAPSISGRKNTMTPASAVYVAGPETKQKAGFYTDDVDEIIRLSGDFSPEVLMPFIERIRTQYEDKPLDQRAEEAYADLDTERKQQICEKIFKALTDATSDPQGVRRPTTLGLLCSLASAGERDVAEVIDAFRRPGRALLTPTPPVRLTLKTNIDLAHERLLQQWERLRTWMDDEAESAHLYQRLAEAAVLYQEGKRTLWRDPELQQALDWRDQTQPSKAWSLRYHQAFEAAMAFLDESLKEPELEVKKEGARRRRRTKGGSYLHGFEHDIYISYAHVDNLPERKGEKGWVERFQQHLSVQLMKRFGKQVSVWRDPELSRAQRFEQVIEKAVRDSGVMISLISPRYLKSDYNKQEVDWFYEKAMAEPVGLTVDDYSRAFPVLLYNIPYDQWPEVFKGTSGFTFHDAEGAEFGDPLDLDSEAFEKQLRGLVEELHAVLTKLQPSFTVFMASSADDMGPAKRQLAKALRGQGINVITNIPPPYDEKEHAKVVQEALKQADLSIHLLSTRSGEPFYEETPEKTYLLEQARLALEHECSKLILMPEEFLDDDIRDAGYAAFIRELRARPRDTGLLELVQTGRHLMLDEILEKIEKLQSTHEEETYSFPCLLVVHSMDTKHLIQVAEVLHKKGIDPVIYQEDNVPGEKILFEERLRQADNLILFYGDVSTDWVKERLDAAIKLAAMEDLNLGLAIFVAPPHKNLADVRDLWPPFVNVHVLDNTEEFNESTILSFLELK